ncbi:MULTISPECIES: SDR family NAD(P)-dependent oxidoreductase [Streptomyces]|uniref:SDR family NAD(P)-dependent oxidoreductase n=1 Tax=Streptomyces sudanensis TaxID=436397 RepID=A0ABY4TD10_9ACTN|nr:MULTISPECIES: SDR family NAD(P)-dependent oxidoreductase [Streptomyces]MCP9956274.1 SDR family NAD(P)-dependent oxidoreductase [Streptomyces sudanensis]MCP9985487.1 SDR family NAD(P)-dependent oxidoreductase [Streptomyces sudanensis]MCQ0003100.1 SDR family NAD(P)-dependent oxidoreductase [Streptomyces sudanensis]URN14702.1 SDR family NAD(P)-dependent oxidoreductase [Streptomyces sudanensis]
MAGTARPVVLITGASSGIGEAVAGRFAADAGRRWRLLLAGRDRERLGEVARRTGGAELPGDLAGLAGVEELAARALEREGRVDVLVAAAGLGWAGPLARTPPEVVERLVAVNLTGAVHLVRLLLPGMVERGAGRVVLVSSMAGWAGVANEAVYAATKGGLLAFAESLRYELAGTRVGVTAVLPGAVDTPFFARRGVPYHRGWPRPVPAGRLADLVWRSVVRGRDEVFAPVWLAGPARLRGGAPGFFRAMAKRFG